MEEMKMADKIITQENNKIVYPINVEYDGNTYTLDFSRATAEELVASGFDSGKLQSQFLIQVPLLWYFAFKKNHSRERLSRKLIDKIWNALAGETEEETSEIRSDLILELVALFSQATESLLVGTNEGNSKKATWKKQR